MNDKTVLFARILAAISLVGACVLPAMAVTIWVFWETFAELAAGNLQHQYDLMNLTVTAKLCGFGVSLVGALIQSFGLLSLRKTFLQAAAGDPLSADALLGFRHFAWVTLIMVPVGVLQNTALVLIFSVSDPTHQGRLEILMGSDEAKALFFGLLLVFVAHVFAVGKAAKDENDSFL